jgi:hypothetical protein
VVREAPQPQVSNFIPIMMTATQVQLKEDTLEFIASLVEDSYYEPDMYVFINEYGEDAFVLYYEKFLELGEEYSYEPVEAFIKEFSLNDLDSFQDAYHGEWSNFSAFAENFFDDVYGHEVPEHLQCYIDYRSFADDLLNDYLIIDNFVFSRCF